MIIAGLEAISGKKAVNDPLRPLRRRAMIRSGKHPNLIFGAITIFAYVGAEVSIGSFLVNYFGQEDIGGLSANSAAGYVSGVFDVDRLRVSKVVDTPSKQ